MKRHLTECEIQKLSKMAEEARILLEETKFSDVEDQNNLKNRLLIIETYIENNRVQTIQQTNKCLYDKIIWVVEKYGRRRSVDCPTFNEHRESPANLYPPLTRARNVSE